MDKDKEGESATMSSTSLLRVFHWGPMVALFIIKWVTLTTLYCSSMLWPPAESVAGLVFMSTFLGNK